uniref:Uncharacterized protein n=1 Tax=Tetranychus urticae TaxID=32264 RepID=T1KLL0_TETUR
MSNLSRSSNKRSIDDASMPGPSTMDEPSIEGPSVLYKAGYYPIEKILRHGFIKCNGKRLHVAVVKWEDTLVRLDERDDNIPWGLTPEDHNLVKSFDEEDLAMPPEVKSAYRCRWCKMGLPSRTFRKRHEKNCIEKI